MQARLRARRRAVGPRHLRRSPVHRRRPGDGAERAADHGRHRPGAGGAGRRAGDLSAGAGERPRASRRPIYMTGAGDRQRDADASSSGWPARAGCWSAIRAPSRCCGSCSKGKDERGDPRLGRGDCRRRRAHLVKRSDSRLMPVIKLSVNVNKVATLRNSRGGQLPSVIEAVRVVLDAGAPGITVHPRADARHITTADVREIADELAPLKGRVEFNIEGDPRPDLLELVLAVQARSVHARAGGARRDHQPGRLAGRHAARRARPASIGAHAGGRRARQPVRRSGAGARFAGRKAMGADRVELYTEPFARAFERGPDAAARELRAVRRRASTSRTSSASASTPATIST